MAEKSFEVQLSGSLGLRDATALAASLKSGLAAYQSVSLSAEGLDGIDISVLQVLVAAGKSAARAGKSLRLVAPPAGIFRETLIKAGFLGADGAPRDGDDELWAGGAGRSKGRAA